MLPKRRFMVFLICLSQLSGQYALSPKMPPLRQQHKQHSRRHILQKWMSTTAVFFLSPFTASLANAACVAGDLDVGKCLGYYRQIDDGSGSATMSFKEAAENVEADLETVKTWKVLVVQSQWEELGRQILTLTPRLRSGSNLYCGSLLKSPLTDGGFEGMSPFREVETCQYAFEDANAALFAFENAVAAAYRSSSAGVRPGGAGSGGGGVLARFGGAGKGGQGASIEQSLAALQMLKELEVRMYVLAASMGLVTLRMEPELISAEDSM